MNNKKIIMIFLFIIILSIIFYQINMNNKKKANFINTEMTNHYIYLVDASNSLSKYLESNNNLSLVRSMRDLYESSISYEKVYSLENKNKFDKSDVNFIINKITENYIYVLSKSSTSEIDKLHEISNFLKEWISFIETNSINENKTNKYNYYELKDFKNIDNFIF